MDIDVISYNTAFQGFVQDDGTIVSTRPWSMPLPNGFYPALVWDTESDPQEQTIAVIEGKAKPTNVFFGIRTNDARSRVYEIKKIDIDNEGAITIEAFHHPTNANGVSLLGVNWTTYVTDANWVIEL